MLCVALLTAENAARLRVGLSEVSVASELGVSAHARAARVFGEVHGIMGS